MTCETIGATTLWGHTRSFVYQVRLADGRNVHMRVDRKGHRSDQRAVVIVDGEKFLALWRSEPGGIHADVSGQDPTTWPNDYKYHHAARGFSYGIDNPVPLADVSCALGERKELVFEPWLHFLQRHVETKIHAVPYVAFTNGITRTIWLLSNGAKAFPVETSSKEASLLEKHAGSGLGTYTVEELLP